MSAILEIPKKLHDHQLSPHWQLGTFEDETGVIFTCPNGHGAWLMMHSIASDGRVNPSCICPKEGCDFHRWIRLENWEPLK